MRNKVLWLPTVTLVFTIISGQPFSALFGANNPQQGPVPRYWRDNAGNEGRVSFPADWYISTNTGWDNIFTNHNGVKFDHNIITANWPRGGHTAAEAKAYFDNKWSAYRPDVSAGSGDPTYNCFAYATHRTCWVQDDAPIWANDYQAAPNNVGAVVAAWIGSHAVVISACAANKAGIAQVKMKDRGSAIFTYNYNAPNYWNGKMAPIYPAVASFFASKP